MSEPFPFSPLQDSLFGEVLLESWKNHGGSSSDLESAIQKALGQTSRGFFFTSNADKQILLNTIPNTIRSLISKKETESMELLFFQLASGSGEYTRPHLDVALELLLWIFTGFEERELFVRLLKKLVIPSQDDPKDWDSFLANPELYDEWVRIYDRKMREE